VRAGIASRKAAVGIGRMAFSRGDPFIHCGDVTVTWIYPTAISLVGQGLNDTLEVAPTKWRELADVSPTDQRLTWYRYDARRSERRLPVEQLW
jgi:hypothetical protein